MFRCCQWYSCAGRSRGTDEAPAATRVLLMRLPLPRRHRGILAAAEQVGNALPHSPARPWLPGFAVPRGVSQGCPRMLSVSSRSALLVAPHRFAGRSARPQGRNGAQAPRAAADAGSGTSREGGRWGRSGAANKGRPSRAVPCCAALSLCISERSGAEPGRQRPAFVRAACAFPSPSVYLFALSSVYLYLQKKTRWYQKDNLQTKNSNIALSILCLNTTDLRISQFKSSLIQQECVQRPANV